MYTAAGSLVRAVCHNNCLPPCQYQVIFRGAKASDTTTCCQQQVDDRLTINKRCRTIGHILLLLLLPFALLSLSICFGDGGDGGVLPIFPLCAAVWSVCAVYNTFFLFLFWIKKAARGGGREAWESDWMGIIDNRLLLRRRCGAVRCDAVGGRFFFLASVLRCGLSDDCVRLKHRQPHSVPSSSSQWMRTRRRRGGGT